MEASFPLLHRALETPARSSASLPCAPYSLYHNHTSYHTIRTDKYHRLASSSHSILNLTTQLIESRDQSPPLFKLCPHIINSLLQNNTLTSSLTFQSGNQFSESIEAFTNCLSSFLLCTIKSVTASKDTVVVEGCRTHQKLCDSPSSHARTAWASHPIHSRTQHLQIPHAAK